MNQRTQADVAGLWDYSREQEPSRYGDALTYEKGMRFLDGHGLIEDWGCGTTYARTFVTRSPYVGVDGSPTRWADQVCDLRSRRSPAPCIFMRHVLEHNLDWRLILDNALESFQRRMVLIVFTPFAAETRVMDPSWTIPDIAFRKSDITECLERRQLSYVEETVATETQYGTETLFYIERARPLPTDL